MANDRHTEVPPHLFSKVQRAILGGGGIAVWALAWQADAPLNGSSSAPSSVNWTLLLLVFAMLVVFLTRPRSDERIASLFSFTALIHLLELTSGFQHYSTMHLSSLLTESLSWTIGGAALVGLFHGWTAICLAWLSARATILALARENRKPVILIAQGLAWVTGAVGVRAVIGYATGSTSLLPG